MARKPIAVKDRFGNSARANVGNFLFEGGQQSREHKIAPRLDKDFDQNINLLGFRELLAVGRFLYANVPALANAVNKIAEIAIGNAFLPQYYGRNRQWGEQAENLLIEWHKVFDVRGGPFVWARNLQLWIKHVLRDGDVAILFVESGNGYPMVQTIPAHRIGGRNFQNGTVAGGQYDGLTIINGVILDPYGRAVALRVVDALQTSFQDVSLVTQVSADTGKIVASRDALFVLDPDWSDATRGITRLAAGVPDWTDLRQVKGFIKQALRKEASFAVVEYNESGTTDTGSDFSRTGPVGTPPVPALYQEKTDGGLTLIYRAGTGSKIEFPAGERPSERSQAFWEQITRDAFQALGWPMEFYDSQRKGGAAIRLIMELAGPTIYRAQELSQEIATAIDAWRIAKAIKSGELPPDPDWWMIEHQLPEELTADKGYSAQIDREDYKTGFTSLKRVAARRGMWAGDLLEERENEANELMVRAARVLGKHNEANPDAKITIDVALSLLRQTSANPPTNAAERQLQDEQQMGEPQASAQSDKKQKA